jgi:hypothetical protein
MPASELVASLNCLAVLCGDRRERFGVAAREALDEGLHARVGHRAQVVAGSNVSLGGVRAAPRSYHRLVDRQSDVEKDQRGLL